MTFLFNDIAASNIVAEACGISFNPACDTSIIRVTDGAIRGGNIYQGYTGASIGVHTAGFDPYWVSSDTLWVMFDYPFNQLGCKKLFGQVPAHNPRALDIDLRLGFTIEARIKDFFPEGDLIVLSMLREDCKWLKLKPRSIRRGVSDGWQKLRACGS